MEPYLTATLYILPDFFLIITPDVTQIERKRTPVRPLAAATITNMCHILNFTCPEVVSVAV